MRGWILAALFFIVRFSFGESHLVQQQRPKDLVDSSESAILRTYQKCLDREPGPQEITQWKQSAAKNGLSNVLASIARSPEARVAAKFLEVHDRWPSDKERAAWTSAFETEGEGVLERISGIVPQQGPGSSGEMPASSGPTHSEGKKMPSEPVSPTPAKKRDVVKYLAGCGCKDKECWDNKILIYQLGTILNALEMGTMGAASAATGALRAILHHAECLISIGILMPAGILMKISACKKLIEKGASLSEVKGCLTDTKDSFFAAAQCMEVDDDYKHRELRVLALFDSLALLAKGGGLLAGSILCAREELREAEESTKQTIEIMKKPRFANLHNNARKLLCELGEPKDKTQCHLNCDRLKAVKFPAQDDQWKDLDFQLVKEAIGMEPSTASGAWRAACLNACADLEHAPKARLCSEWNHAGSKANYRDLPMGAHINPASRVARFQKWLEIPGCLRPKDPAFGELEKILKHEKATMNERGLTALGKAKAYHVFCVAEEKEEKSKLQTQLGILRDSYGYLRAVAKGRSGGVDISRLGKLMAGDIPLLRDLLRSLFVPEKIAYGDFLDTAFIPSGAPELPSLLKKSRIPLPYPVRPLGTDYPEPDGEFTLEDIKAFEKEVASFTGFCSRNEVQFKGP